MHVNVAQMSWAIECISSFFVFEVWASRFSRRRVQDPAQVGCSVDVWRIGGGAGWMNGTARSMAGGLGVGGGVSRSLVGILRFELRAFRGGFEGESGWI